LDDDRSVPCLQNEKVALALAPALTIIFVLFGGFYANTNTIPK